MSWNSRAPVWGIPFDFQDIMDQKIDQPTEVLDKCKEWLMSDQRFFVISGSHGTGKTALACHMLKSWIGANSIKMAEMPLEGRFMKEYDIYYWWTVQSRSGDLEKLSRAICDYEIIVIDNIGTRSTPEEFKYFIFSIIDKRMDERKKTIITTNLDRDGFKELYGVELMSRVLMGTQVKINGKDRRFDRKDI